MNRKTLCFGRYPMDEEGRDLSPITWIIYKSTEDKLFLISQDILDYREFSDEENNNWNESTLKKWLNTEFLDAAFSEQEKDQLVDFGENERVSLLGAADFNECFVSNTKGLKAKYTDYARSKTKNIYGQVFEGVYGFYWMKTANKNLTAADLASPTQHATPAVYVYHVTNRGVANGYERSNWKDGVRPVICLKK